MGSNLKILLKDPLLQFLIAGLCLFFLLSFLSQEQFSEKEIVVDRETLLTFIQYRTKAFRKDVAAQRLDAMSDKEREQLTSDYVQEEAMYRESKSIGLAGDDYVIRRRMVQKLEFITQGFVEQELNKTEQGLVEYFAENISDYYIEPAITFTHVFLSTKKLTAEQRQPEIEILKQRLIEQDVQISQATQYGERFPFHVNYVEKTPDFIASHFGEEFSAAVFNIRPDDTNIWLGPIASEYGLHLINVRKNLLGREAELEQVRNIVEQDYHQFLLRQEQQKAYDKIVERYRVVTP